jgi:hypothetical protein
MHDPKMATVQYFKWDCNSSFKWIGKPVYDYLHNRVLLTSDQGLMSNLENVGLSGRPPPGIGVRPTADIGCDGKAPVTIPWRQ